MLHLYFQKLKIFLLASGIERHDSFLLDSGNLRSASLLSSLKAVLAQVKSVLAIPILALVLDVEGRGF